ncbi:MAG: aconitase family protein [Emergencia sp.]
MKKKLTPDVIMINDGIGHEAADAFVKGEKTVADNIKDRVVVILDHDIPAGSFDTAFIQKKLIDFAKTTGVAFRNAEGTGYAVLTKEMKKGQIFASCGRHNAFAGAMGALGIGLSAEEMEQLLERGEIEVDIPGTFSVVLEGGLPEHTDGWDLAMRLMSDEKMQAAAGKIIQFIDRTDEGLSVDEKQKICLAAAGCKAFSAVFDETDAADFRICLNETENMAALPGCESDTRKLSGTERVRVDACFIGGCAGGHIGDIRKAAEILKGKRIRRELRLLIGFADNETYLTAVHEGLIDIFFDAGAQVTNPGCGSCRTTSIGVVGDGEVLASTGCYNYAGCAGTPESEVYLVSAETAARAALNGYIGGETDGK